MEIQSESKFKTQMAFSKPWRPYQARILEELQGYLDDRRFHLVSAPGSGKTVTGLEVVRRIGEPALILTPTIAIREQWVDRLTLDFLDGESEPEWLSRDLKKPREITVSTYQSLSAEFRKEGGADAVLAAIEAAGISTLVVDEAHHLRAVWWQCLDTLKDFISGPWVVALTATPPIDVPAAEWNRYVSFCGQVDIEVGIPELVAAGNLCPHQDYVILSEPSGEDVEGLRRFHSGVHEMIGDLEIDIKLAEDLGLNSNIEWVADTDTDEFRKRHQRFYLALAIFSQRTGGYIPDSIRIAFDIDGEELPDRLGIDWSALLLQGILFDFRKRIELTKGLARHIPGKLKQLEERLREIGAIEKGQVVLEGGQENAKLLKNSPSKLESITQIIDLEVQSQTVLMRAVVLTDYLRKEAFPSSAEIDPPMVKLGVVPIFETLRRVGLPMVSIGILTGTLVIVPVTTKSRLKEVAEQKNIRSDRLSFEPLDHDAKYVLVVVRDNDRQRLIAAMTQVFEEGEINCLIGTASLLGEGWDAPALNTLVLASVIGSFVMSNQMRGRAIRTNPGIPEKTANIWHVATVTPDLGGKGSYHPGSDLVKLERRFDSFYGVGFALDEKGEAAVTNGWQRIGMQSADCLESVDAHNQRMYSQAEQRENIEYIWKRAIAPITDGRFLRPIRALKTPRKLVASRFIMKVAGQSSMGVRHKIAGWLEQRRLYRIAEAIGYSLHLRGTIVDFRSKADIRVDVNPQRCNITAPRLDSAEQEVLIDSLQEFFDVFQNPRYLVLQDGNYFSVPKALGENKELALEFSSALRKGFGKHELIFTQSKEGKVHLLEARKARLLNQFEFKTDTHITWKPTAITEPF